MQPNAFVQWLSNQKLKIEIVLVILIVVCAYLNYNHYARGAEGLMIFMSALSGFYFISAFFMLEINSPIMAIGIKLFSIGSAVCVNALLFTILKLTGAQQMLTIGTLAIGGSGLIILYFAITSWDSKYLPFFVRLVLISTISTSTLLTLMKNSGSQIPGH